MKASVSKNTSALEEFSGDPSIENIIRFIADRNRLSSADLIGRSRKADIVEARFDAIAEVYRLRRDLSLTDIGIAFGGRDYSTIRNALQHREIEIDVPISGIIDRDAVVAAAKKGFPSEELADRFHCSRASIRKILWEAKVPFKS
jgi:Bacterial dnaA protein helix-turn-helix